MLGELLEAERVRSIVASFFTVFNYYGGGGMCEAAYIGALEHELTLRGHKVDREVSVPVYYKGKLVARQRLDMVVDDRVIVEWPTPKVLSLRRLQEETTVQIVTTMKQFA
jgi:GxxExxY protein